jgi:hypothetical protein
MAVQDCGLYRTGQSLSGHDEHVGEGRLVYFHNHSEQGPPLVLTPHANSHNRWQFHDRGFLVEDEAFLDALIALKPEGFYINTEHLHISREEIIPPHSLLQLGYNREADSILFVARFEGNTISFPSEGYSFSSPDIQKVLEPAGFAFPRPKAESDLH